jgi:hypothetical protein
MAIRNHMLDLMLAVVATLGLVIALSVEHASAMDVPPPMAAQMHVLAP